MGNLYSYEISKTVHDRSRVRQAVGIAWDWKYTSDPTMTYDDWGRTMDMLNDYKKVDEQEPEE